MGIPTENGSLIPYPLSLQLQPSSNNFYRKFAKNYALKLLVIGDFMCGFSFPTVKVASLSLRETHVLVRFMLILCFLKEQSCYIGTVSAGVV